MISTLQAGPSGQDAGDDVARVQALHQACTAIREEIGRRVVGQQKVVEHLLITLFARGHGLFVGVPGLAKTLLIHTLADVLDLEFNRIQFTPDLMPSDITGTDIIEQDAEGKRHFRFVKGPVFCNILLADEINRTPPKTQAALLQSMQESRVTAAGTTYPLAPPFHVFATQNPIEQEGTYPLPEAQIDRFMLKLKVGYPDRSEEKEIMRRMSTRHRPKVEAVITVDEIRKAREVADQMYVDAKVEDYIVDIVFASRSPRMFKLEKLERLIEHGASPRASIFLAQAAKVHAFLEGRAYVTPQDVKSIGPDVLRHRIMVSYEAEAQDLQSDDIIQEIFNTVDVP